jgi:hypothetical protein
LAHAVLNRDEKFLVRRRRELRIEHTFEYTQQG